MIDRQAFRNAQEIIYKTISPTPQLAWPLLAERCSAEVWVKHENHLPTGSFKVRGGLLFANRLASEQCPGVVAATRGNHGQSVAYAASRAGISSVVVVPVGNDSDKNRAMRAYGAELIEHGRDFDEAYAHAHDLADTRGLRLFPSFDPVLVTGVGTYAIEFFEAVQNIDTVYVPIGLGSGICGVIAARDALGLDTNIVGVVAENADCYARSFAAGEVQTTATAETIADGLAVRTPNRDAVQTIVKQVARVVAVTESEIAAAMRIYFEDTHNIAEGAAAAPLAALLRESAEMSGKRVGLVMTGGNINAEKYARILQTAVS